MNLFSNHANNWQWKGLLTCGSLLCSTVSDCHTTSEIELLTHSCPFCHLSPFMHKLCTNLQNLCSNFDQQYLRKLLIDFDNWNIMLGCNFLRNLFLALKLEIFFDFLNQWYADAIGQEGVWKGSSLLQEKYKYQIKSNHCIWNLHYTTHGYIDLFFKRTLLVITHVM